MVQDLFVKILPTLPTEVHNEIFQYLSFQERWQMAQVCQSWRYTVLNWQPQWKSLPIHHHCSIVPDMLPYAPFIESGSVKKIRVHYFNHSYLSNTLYFIYKHQFHLISKVDLAVPEFSKEQLETLVQTSKDALTDIKIAGLGNFRNNVGPDTLLKQCPNLIKLDFNGCVFVEDGRYNPTDAVGLKHDSLLAMSLRFHNMEEFRSFDPSPYLKAVPNLRYLSLNIAHLQVQGAHLADMIRDHCPGLEILVIFENVRGGERIPEMHKVIMNHGQHGIIRDEKLVASITTPSPRPSSPSSLSSFSSSSSISSSMEEITLLTQQQRRRGLQHLVIHQHNFALTARRICEPLMDAFHQELVTLDFAGAGVVNNYILNHISTLPFPSLKHLKLRNNDFAPPDLVSDTMLSVFRRWDSINSNHLTHLVLSNLNISLNDTLLSLIGVTCLSLQDIILDNTYLITDDGMLSFLEHQQQRYLLHQQQTAIEEERGGNYLRGITLDSVRRAMDSRVLSFMGREMGYLERVTLRSATFDYDGYDHMNKFVSVRQYCFNRQRKNPTAYARENNDYFLIRPLENLEISFYEYQGMETDQINQRLETLFQGTMDEIANHWSYIVEKRDEVGQVPGAVTIKRKITEVEFRTERGV